MIIFWGKQGDYLARPAERLATTPTTRRSRATLSTTAEMGSGSRRFAQQDDWAKQPVVLAEVVPDGRSVIVHLLCRLSVM